MPQPSHDLQTSTHGVLRGHVVVAVKLMRERLAEPWTDGALAEAVHLSRSHLFRCFDATVNMSPMAYLRQMRVERMARLLLSTDLSIAEVALAVGWKDPSYATRCFHANVGMSPMAYLRQMRAEKMAQLLLCTDLSVAEVARSVGWRDQFHASRCFSAAYGVSPTEFRRRHATPPRIA